MPRGRYPQGAQRRQGQAQARPPAPSRRGRGRAKAGSPAPWDSRAQRESAELGNESADTRVSLGADLQQITDEAGLGDGAANPYSTAMALKRQKEVDQRRALTTAGGGLYSGSTLNASRAAASRYDEGLKGLETEVDRAKATYDRGVGQTTRDETIGRLGIKEGAIERAAATEPASLAPGRGRGRVGRRPASGVPRARAGRRSRRGRV